MEIITLNEYASKVNCNLVDATLQDIQQYVEDNFDLTLWDYPIEELDYVINEVNESVCLVKVGDEVRVCEI
jgi:hypothetical protein